MSKFRPSPGGGIYIIPDIHNRYNELKLILDRITPLRKSEGIKDKIIFLGDYLDRGPNPFETIEVLIKIKKKHPDQVVFLTGNHDAFLLKACNLSPGRTLSLQDQELNYRMFLNNGGYNTIQGYIKALNREDNVLNFPRSKLSSLIPKAHLEFLLEAAPYHIEGNYHFVHGGCNPNIPLNKQDPEALYWDRRLGQFVLNCIAFEKQEELNWPQTIVCGHSGPTPIIHEKFLMLDAGMQDLLVVELNSLEAFTAKPGNNRLVKYNLLPTVKKPGLFKRVDF